MQSLCQHLLTHQRNGKILSDVRQLQGHSEEFSSSTNLKDRGDE